MPALGAWRLILAIALVVVSGVAAPHRSAAAEPAGSGCNVKMEFDDLRVDRHGGAKFQVITVNEDCTLTKGPVHFIQPGTLEFEQFLASKRQTAAAKKRAADPECWSELDYQDPIGLNLTLTRLGMPYSYNYAAGQVTAVYPLDWVASPAVDGWYLISQATTPYSGPLPYGQINTQGTAEFAWVAGSFWHRHTNHNSADGFGTCFGYPGEEGSTVPLGTWVWGMWQF